MSEEEVVQEPVEESTAIVTARKGGWCPEDDWKGSKEDWVDAGTFNRNGEFMRRINEQSSIIKHLTTKVDDRDLIIGDMSKLADTISEREYKNALATLMTQKTAAMEEDDHRKVVEVDEEISELKDHKPVPVPKTTAPESTTNADIAPEIIDWLSKPDQSWYHTDAGMRGMADAIANKLDNLSPTAMLTEVDRQMRLEMPHKFQTAGEIDSGGEYNSPGRKGPKGKYKFSDLTEMEQDTCKRFEKQGVMNRQEYMDQLFGLEE